MALARNQLKLSIRHVHVHVPPRWRRCPARVAYYCFPTANCVSSSRVFRYRMAFPEGRTAGCQAGSFSLPGPPFA
eukprot:gene25626-32000_t